MVPEGSFEAELLNTNLYPSGNAGKGVGAAFVASIGSLLYVTLPPTSALVVLSLYLILPNLV